MNGGRVEWAAAVPMLTRTIAALSVAFLVQSPGMPAHPAAAGQRMMTEDAALSALRSNGRSAPGADLVIARRIEPTPDTRRVAEASLHEIESRHLTERSKGLLAEFLRAGGFVVLCGPFVVRWHCQSLPPMPRWPFGRRSRNCSIRNRFTRGTSSQRESDS